MENFKFNAYTEMLFGKGQIEKLPEVINRFGKNVLLAYGGGSIKKNGIYDNVKKLLNDYNIIELEYQYDIINFNKYINALSRFRIAHIKCKININKIVKTIYINLTFLQKVGRGKVLCNNLQIVSNDI